MWDGAQEISAGAVPSPSLSPSRCSPTRHSIAVALSYNTKPWVGFFLYLHLFGKTFKLAQSLAGSVYGCSGSRSERPDSVANQGLEMLRGNGQAEAVLYRTATLTLFHND